MGQLAKGTWNGAFNGHVKINLDSLTKCDNKQKMIPFIIFDPSFMYCQEIDGKLPID